MADNQVQVEISIEEKAALRALTQLSKGVEGFEKQTQKSVSKADVFFANFAANIATNLVNGAFKLASAAISYFSGALSEGIKLAQIQEDAINSLNSQLARTGDFSKETSKDLQDFASSLQSVTKFGDEAILNQLSLSQALGATVEESKAVLVAAADLSQALGISLDTAVQELSKSLEGNAGTLTRLIPEISNFSKEELKAGAVLDLVTNKFSGAATAATRTFSGAMTQTSNIIGDTRENLGLLITSSPLVIGAIKAMGTSLLLFDNLTKSSGETFKETIEGPISNAMIKFAEVSTRAFIAATKTVNLFLNALSMTNAGINTIHEFIASIAGIGPAEAVARKATEESINAILERNEAVELLEKNIVSFSSTVIESFKTEVEAARAAKDSIGIINQEKLSNEAVANEATLEQRRQLKADLEALEADKSIKEIELSQSDNLRRGEERVTELEAIRQHEQDKILIQYEAALEKNSLIQDATNRELADKSAAISRDIAMKQTQVKTEKAIEAERQLIRDTQLRGLQANIQAGIALTKQGTAENKALQIANAVISTYSAANLALANPPGPPFTIPLAAAAIFQGLANVQRIQSQSFATGGVVGGFSGATSGADNRKVNARNGEMFLNASQQKTLFDIASKKGSNSSTMDEIRAIANQPVVIQIDGREVARTVRNQKLAGFTI